VTVDGKTSCVLCAVRELSAANIMQVAAAGSRSVL